MITSNVTTSWRIDTVVCESLKGSFLNVSHMSAALQDQWHGSKCNLWSPTRTRWDYQGKLIFLLDMTLPGTSFKKCDDIFRQLSLIWAHSWGAHGTWLLPFLPHGGSLTNIMFIMCRPVRRSRNKASAPQWHQCLLCPLFFFVHKSDKLFVNISDHTF